MGKGEGRRRHRRTLSGAGCEAAPGPAGMGARVASQLGGFYLPFAQASQGRWAIHGLGFCARRSKTARVLIIGDSVSRGLYAGGTNGPRGQGQCSSRASELWPNLDRY